jgi:hypothetical protein
MTLTVDKAAWSRQADGFYLSLRVQEPAAAQTVCTQLADGKPREMTIKSKKRSLDANAYAWVLMNRIAEALRISPVEVYQMHLRDIPEASEPMLVREDRLEAWDELWCKGHLGRCTVDMGPSRIIEGYHTVLCYVGSSDFSSSQMAQLIDLIVEDCKALGIECLTEKERALLKEEWK